MTILRDVVIVLLYCTWVDGTVSDESVKSARDSHIYIHMLVSYLDKCPCIHSLALNEVTKWR